LIVRLSAIGDVVHTLPVLCALRERMPRAFLAWAVEGRAAELLRSHRALDELIELERGWLKNPGKVLALRRRLRDLKFDIAIDAQGLSKSAIAARLSGAKLRVGFGGADGREISRLLNNCLVPPRSTHVVDRNLELLEALGIIGPGVRFDLEDSPSHARAASDMVEAFGLGGRFAVINPGAGWPSKVWPAERFAGVARHLGLKHKMPSLVVWAGDQERQWAEKIVSSSQGKARLAGSTSLKELAALARRSSLFIASDTGPLHLAAAVGVPCVGLFGPMPAERNGPYGAGSVAVQKMLLSGTSRQRRTANNRSMEAISIEDVCAACDEALARGAARRSA
jgi:lipopolysaccharide heptosyltransferase I